MNNKNPAKKKCQTSNCQLKTKDDNPPPYDSHSMNTTTLAPPYCYASHPLLVAPHQLWYIPYVLLASVAACMGMAWYHPTQHSGWFLCTDLNNYNGNISHTNTTAQMDGGSVAYSHSSEVSADRSGRGPLSWLL